MLRSSLVILLLALSASASAEGFNYNFVSAGYGTTDFDGIGDGDGFTLRGSYAFNNDIHGFAGYESAGLDFGIDATRWNAGFGYNTSMSDKLDLVARLSYEYIEFDGGILSNVDDTGYGFGVGMRYAANQQLELNAGIKYVDYGDLGDDTGLQLAALYDFTETFTLGFNAGFSDDVTTYSLSGRYYFGR